MTSAIAKTEPPSLFALIARAASDPSVDVQKFEALVRIQRELAADDQKRQFNEAFARLQPRLPRIKKNGQVKYPVNKNNPEGPQKHAFFYSRWEDIDDAIRPIMNEEGFSFSVDTAPHAAGGVIGTGTLMHIGGYSRSASIGPVPLDTSGGKNNLQAAGSTTSYIARYTAKMLLNLVFEGEDDDGVRGGEQRITEAQIGNITKLIRETKSDLDAFLRFMKTETLADIQVDDYPKAINALMAKKAQNPAVPVPPAQPPANPSRGVPPPDRDDGASRAPPEAATLSFAIAPQRGSRGIEWKATKDALMARARLIENPAEFARLRTDSHETIELLRNAAKPLWLDFNFESGQMEQALREKANA